MPDVVLTGVQARSPCVYVSKRGDTVHYVGVSRVGIARALTRQRDYLDEIFPTDALEVYLMPGADSVALHAREWGRVVDGATDGATAAGRRSC